MNYVKDTSSSSICMCNRTYVRRVVYCTQLHDDPFSSRSYPSHFITQLREVSKPPKWISLKALKAEWMVSFQWVVILSTYCTLFPACIVCCQHGCLLTDRLKMRLAFYSSEKTNWENWTVHSLHMLVKTLFHKQLHMHTKHQT